MLLLIVVLAVVLIAIERKVQARPWPRVGGWWLRAGLFNVVQLSIAVVAGYLWEPWMASHRPFSLDALGIVGGALVGYFVLTFLYYWWHRARHAVPLLWRHLHQLHHSPARIEILTSFYKHPLEIFVNSLLSAAILSFLVGLGPAAAALAILLTGLAEFFYHWNVRTPYWVGFVLQRPESHCVHHQRGRHAGNYADLPLWDWMFGTLDNPRDWHGECGFEEAAERRVGAMLRGEEVA